MRKMIRTSFLCLSALLALSSAVTNAHAQDTDDLVMLSNGGRVRGVVIEEDPKLGVRIKLLDGTLRTLKPEEVREVRYHGEAPAAPAAASAAFPTLAPAAPVPAPVPEPAQPPAVGVAPVPPAPAPPLYGPPPTAGYYYPPPPQRSSQHEFQLGARIGVSLPLGKYASGGGSANDLSYAITLRLPVLIEAGYEVAPNFLLGVHGQYGFYFEKASTGCQPGFSCSEHDVELGIDAQYHFGLGKPVDAWLGLGFGYEYDSATATAQEHGGATISQSGTTKGPQYFKLQGGADFKVARVLTVGPFLSFSLGEYTRVSYTEQLTGSGQSSNESSGAEIPNTALHGWLSVGVKGTFHIGTD